MALCSELRKAHRFGVGQPAPIVIDRSVNGAGETFALDPDSRDRLLAEFGSTAHMRPRVFIAHEAHGDHGVVQESIVPQVVQLLTGLPLERVQALGRVIFRDPVTESELPLTAA